MNRTDKQQVVEDLNQVFSKNAGIFLFGFSGIDVPQITELRSKVYQSGCGYRVVKNRLAKRAAQDTVMEQLADSSPNIRVTCDDVVGRWFRCWQ